MSKCICGLDHTKPIPDTFKWAPIVFASWYDKAVCHACGAEGPKDRSFFTNPFLHNTGCKYMKYLTEKERG